MLYVLPKLPKPTKNVLNTLFCGNIFFVQITFNTPTGPVLAINNQDINTAINYARLAATPIQSYISQYGSSGIRISQQKLQCAVTLSGNSFSDQKLQGWVDNIVSTNNLARNSCIVILNYLTSPKNSDAPINMVRGYHWITGGGIPYCYCYVQSSPFTIDDQKNAYAVVVSHEIAEMTADPAVNGNNPEV
jgi:hypothetical protein